MGRSQHIHIVGTASCESMPLKLLSYIVPHVATLSARHHVIMQDEQNSQQERELRDVAQVGDLKTVETLLARGVDVDAKEVVTSTSL